ncbi:MAG TPA: Crp/Fnr family transcriptional regulator [Saprospiraceae bacterium]|nr:Crp/Fnr family transcriptional regulator [Saprospiraceae bacterium]HMP24114.1 Crp/Fnr family transcriptional regulator [Saprospiraceae bacterium]
MNHFPVALYQLFHDLGQLTEAETHTVLKHWRHQFQLQRWEYLSTPDRRDYYMYFVLAGALRIYCVNAQGEETCLGFSYTHSLAGSYPSLITGEPSVFYVQALSPCTLLGMLWEDFVRIAETMPNLERCRRILAEQTLLGRMEREIELFTLTPAERYERVLKRSPQLFQLVPQKYIASYLGMTPETLSRIRRKR